MTKRNDIASLLQQGAQDKEIGILKATEKASQPKKAGRKPKPPEEKANKPVTLYFTEREYNNLAEKADMVKIATYLRKAIERNTDISDIFS